MAESAFALALALQGALEADLRAAYAGLQAIDGVGTGPFGLTPDAIKADPEYRAAKAATDKAFARLRGFNAWYVKQFANERAVARGA